MIPLMFIQKKENLLTETTAAITKINANYLQLRRAIEISYKINLDDNFSLMIELNEFDEPSNVYIKTLRSTDYQKVSPDVPSYTIESEREVVVISYDTIIKIAHNAAKYADVKNVDIKAKMLNSYKDPSVVMTYFSYDYGIANFVVCGNKFTYAEDVLMPVLYCNEEEIEPSRIIGNYYVYDVTLNDEPYEIALMHIKSFKNHYLFRQTESTHELKLKGNTLYDYYNKAYTFVDGLIAINNTNFSVQKYFEEVYNEEYKQYFFNVIRDKNLYTEIANAFDAAKHHTFNAFNFKTDERLMGKVKVRAEYNNKSIPEFVIELDKPFNQFLKRTDYNIQFRFPVYNLLHILNETSNNYRLIDYGYFIVNSEIAPVTDNIINNEEFEYVTASNNEWFFSISDNLLSNMLENVSVYLMPVLKGLNTDTYLSSIYNLKEIDYINKKVYLNNVFDIIPVDFKDIDKTPGLVIGKNSRMFTQNIGNLFGIDFLINPDKMVFNPVTPDIYDEISLLIKSCESEDYLITEIEADTMRYARALKIEIANTVYMFIFNIAKGYVYYLDISNHTATRDANGLESMLTFMKVSNESELVNILESFSSFIYVIRDNGYGVNVDEKLNVIPYMVYFTLDNPLFSSQKGLVEPSLNTGYSTRNNKVATSYNYSSDTYKEAFRGVFAGLGVKILSISLNNNALIVNTVKDGSNFLIEIKIDANGKYICKDIFNKPVELPFDKDALDTSYGAIAFNDYIAIDLNIVNKYITSGTLTINDEAYVFDDNKCLVIQTTQKITELTKEDNYQYNGKAVGMIENWLGDEFFGIITTDSLDFLNIGDCYCYIDTYEDDNKKIKRINADVSKYIVRQ